MKKGPIIFLGVLVAALVFILGVSYGKRVNVADSAFALLLSITPSPIPAQTGKSLGETYDTFQSTECNVSFLYPTRTIIHTSTEAASFEENNDKESIDVLCSMKLSLDSYQKEPTSSAILDSVPSVKSELLTKSKNKTLFSLTNPVNKKQVVLSVPRPLVPLIERTFEFSNNP